MHKSTRSNFGLLLGLTFTVAASACEHGITLRGHVDVAVDLQRQFSKAAPALVVMGGGFGGGTVSAQQLAVLCDPTAETLSIPFLQDQYGCAAEGTVWFHVYPLAPADRQAFACGIRQEEFSAQFNNHRLTDLAAYDKDRAVAITTVTIFAGEGGFCSSGDENIAATLWASK